jgi:hypothetical protein
MIGKALAFSFVGGTTLAIYMCFGEPQPYPVHPPLRPVPTVTVTVTPTTTKPSIPSCCGTDSDRTPDTYAPQYVPPTPMPGPTPTHWPGQHYGETLT